MVPSEVAVRLLKLTLNGLAEESTRNLFFLGLFIGKPWFWWKNMGKWSSKKHGVYICRYYIYILYIYISMNIHISISIYIYLSISIYLWDNFPVLKNDNINNINGGPSGDYTMLIPWCKKAPKWPFWSKELLWKILVSWAYYS